MIRGDDARFGGRADRQFFMIYFSRKDGFVRRIGLNKGGRCEVMK